MDLVRIREQASSILKVRGRVRFLYDTFPSTIETDNALLMWYESVFGNTRMREDTIKRAGRNLRQKHSDKYKRTDEKVLRDMETTIANVKVWRD